MRPSREALKRLQAIKRRHMKNCSNVYEVVIRLWQFYQEQHERRPTQDLHLTESTMCPARFQLNEAFFCGWGLPRRKSRKIKSLKECEICLAKNKQKIQKVAIQKAGLKVPENMVGKGLTKKTENIKAYAQSLAEGKYKRYCPIVGKSLKLFELPCVVNSNSFKEPFNCKHGDCEAQIKLYVKAYYLS
jgi:hypothetical protein